MVGMRDVAKKAGVSLSTVSLVMNGNGYVSAAMRERVEAAMSELNYIPNELGRNLFRNRTDTVGIIVPTIRHPFFGALTASLQHSLAAHGLRTLLCSTADVEQGEAEYVGMLQRHMMDGIVMAAHTTHTPDYWTSINCPIVAFDRRLGHGIPSIGSNHGQGGELIADLLIRTNARSVLLVGGPRHQFHDVPDVEGGTTFPTIRYYQTVERLLADRGIRCRYIEVPDVADFDAYRTAIHQALPAFPDADAIVSPDMGAAYAVQELTRLGRSIPGDIQVIAYDGTHMADAAGKRLTAIQQDFDALGAGVADTMAALIEGRSPERLALAPVSLRVGDTTRA